MSHARAGIILVENKWQARKLRWVCWGSVVWTIAWLAWAVDLAETYGLSPGDGGVLRPFGERLAYAAVLTVIAVLPLVGLIWYSRRYIVAMSRSGGMVDVTMLGFWRPLRRRYAVAAFGPSTTHGGRMSAGGLTVNAPWITLRIGGKRHFVDLQSERADTRRLTALGIDAQRRRT